MSYDALAVFMIRPASCLLLNRRYVIEGNIGKYAAFSKCYPQQP